MRPVTLNATIACAHGPGRVRLTSSQEFVRIDTVPVLVQGDTLGKRVVGCPPTPPLKPCLVTTAEREGVSDLVRIDGSAILLDTLAGVTSGDPPGVVNYTVRRPGQALVEQG